ncbi:MAG: bifunctional oligoribonuclease/PAP phosphatase NrnA [Bacteroidales bacterium]|nr:bifunctional oligoribonuclease/PAP phosphatase NrnA [Bacteroidales bacterium]
MQDHNQPESITPGFSEVSELIRKNGEICIITHHNPDGDAIGSVLALYHFVKKRGKNVCVIVPNGFPRFLSWLPGSELILLYDRQKELCDSRIHSAGLIFALDLNNPKRLEKACDAFCESAAKKVLIDHHLDPERKWFDVVISASETSSTAEMVYDFMKSDDPGLLDREIALALFTGIMTDTGSFSYNCNYSRTYRIVAELIDLGIDAVDVHQRVYDTFSEDRLRLLGYCLSRKLTVIPEYRTAYITLTREELKAHHHRTGDTEGIVNYALSIEGIRLAALFTEKEDRIRISFRSRGEFSVNDLARRHFLGGGHKNAAGGDSYGSMEETVERFRSLLKKYHSLLK